MPTSDHRASDRDTEASMIAPDTRGMNFYAADRHRPYCMHVIGSVVIVNGSNITRPTANSSQWHSVTSAKSAA